MQLPAAAQEEHRLPSLWEGRCGRRSHFAARVHPMVCMRRAPSGPPDRLGSLCSSAAPAANCTVPAEHSSLLDRLARFLPRLEAVLEMIDDLLVLEERQRLRAASAGGAVDDDRRRRVERGDLLCK